MRTLIPGLSVLLRPTLLKRTTAALAIDVDTELPHVQSARLQRRLKSILAVDEKLANFESIGREMGMDKIISHRNANIHMPEIWLIHIHDYGSHRWIPSRWGHILCTETRLYVSA
jgi:hypothetical protein